jgi:HK97 family phage prohead protease
MPYYITDKSADCNGWATVKADGEVLGCHKTKKDAIGQMVAVSLSEGIEPAGERALNGELEVGDFVFWENGQNFEFGLITFISTYGPITNQLGATFIATQEKPLASIIVYLLDDNQLLETDQFVIKDFAPLTKIGELPDEDEMSPEMDDTSDDERAMPDDLKEGDFVSWNSSGGRARGRIEYVMKDGTLGIPDSSFKINASADDPAALIRIWREDTDGEWNETEVLVGHKFSTLTKIDSLARNLNERAINQEAPAFMRAAARRGLELYADGKGGDGLVDKTIREARLMAQGQVSDDKWIRIAAWISRHTSDLDSPDANPDSENYPSAGVVAHLLWGSGPSKRQAQRTLAYAERVAERVKAEESQRWSSISINLNKDERTPVSKQVERRVSHVEFDVREMDTTGDKMTFRGYAAVFNSASQPLPFTEFIREGAFTRSLKSRNEIKMFKNHNTDIVLGSTRAGTLRLIEDSKGLLAEADLPPTTDGKDLSILMQRGDVNSMSFGFSVPARGDSWSDDGQTRELHQIRLHEVSIVTGFPAYEATSASVRSLDYLATRTAVDVDALADALTRLESGEELDSTHADIISEVVTKLRKDKPVESDFAPELLELKKKQLDLMAKVF